MKLKPIYMLLLLGSSNIYADIVMPVFSGSWYSDVKYIDYDNCIASLYKYSNLSNDRQNTVNEYIKTLPQYQGCSWKVVADELEDARPDDFPGTEDQLQQLLRNGSPASHLYTVDCINSNGHDEYHQWFQVSPQYICPKGSRYSFDIKNHTTGCTNKPDLCAGDIVMRNLALPTQGVWGHAGVTTVGRSVVNILPDDIKLYITTSHNDLIKFTFFPVFYNITRYWGDKYGTLTHSIITFDEGMDVLNSVALNTLFPSLYTLDSKFVPAESFNKIPVYNTLTNKWEDSFAKLIEKWRCDTFADWVYAQGTADEVIPFVPDNDNLGGFKYVHRAYMPYNLYEALLNTRDNGELGKISEAEKATIQAERPKDNMLYQLLSHATLLADNKKISRSERIQTLYQELNQQQKDDHFAVVADALSNLHPIEIASQLIQQYNPDTSTIRKQWIIYLLQSASEVNPQAMPQSNLQKIKQIQSFLQDQIQKEKNTNVLPFIVQTYNNVMPFSEEKVNLINSTLIKLTSSYALSNRFLLALNDPTGQLMKQLVNDKNSSSDVEQLDSLITMFVNNNASLLSTMPQLVLRELTNGVAEQLKQTPSLTQHHKADPSEELVYVQYYQLIKTYGLLTGNTHNASDFIMHISNTMLQAKMVKYAYTDKKEKALFNGLDKPLLIANYSALANEQKLANNRDSEQQLYISAIATLDGSLERFMAEQNAIAKAKLKEGKGTNK